MINRKTRGAESRTWARGQLKYYGSPVLWTPKTDGKNATVLSEFWCDLQKKKKERSSVFHILISQCHFDKHSEASGPPEANGPHDWHLKPMSPLKSMNLGVIVPPSRRFCARLTDQTVYHLPRYSVWPRRGDLSNALYQLKEFYKINNLRTNPSKTQVCAFHLKNRYANKKLIIIRDGQLQLQHCDNLAYLGVAHDCSLTFKNMSPKPKCQQVITSWKS